MSDEYLEAMSDDFGKVIDSFTKDLSTIRTGRASPRLLESVQVAVASYGATMPLNQLATITAPDARLLVVNPWDKGTIHDVEKGIMAAGLPRRPPRDPTAAALTRSAPSRGGGAVNEAEPRQVGARVAIKAPRGDIDASLTRHSGRSTLRTTGVQREQQRCERDFGGHCRGLRRWCCFRV